MPDRATVNKFRPLSPAEVEAIAQKLAGTYARTETELLRLLTQKDITSWRRAYATQQLAQVQSLLQGLKETTVLWSQQEIPALYKRGLWTADGYLQPPGLSVAASPGEYTPMDLGMTRLHNTAVTILTENVALRLGEANSYCAQRIQDMVARAARIADMAQIPEGQAMLQQMQIRDASLRSMQQAFGQGLTRREASKRFVTELQSRGITTFIDKAGREWNMSTYSAMVCRTVSHETQRHGLQNRMIEMNEDVVEVIPVSRFKDSCDRYENQLLSITGRTKGKYVGSRRIIDSVDNAMATSHLFGPNCVHSAVPYLGGGEVGEEIPVTDGPAGEGGAIEVTEDDE